MAKKPAKFKAVDAKSAKVQVKENSAASDTEKQELDQLEEPKKVEVFNNEIDKLLDEPADKEETEEVVYQVEVEPGVFFTIDKFRESTVKYMGVIQAGTGDKLQSFLKIIKRIIVADERIKFEQWYYTKTDQLTDAFEAWEDSGEKGDPPESIEDWLMSFTAEFAEQITRLVESVDPKDIT